MSQVFTWIGQILGYGFATVGGKTISMGNVFGWGIIGTVALWTVWFILSTIFMLLFRNLQPFRTFWDVRRLVGDFRYWSDKFGKKE